VTSSLVSLIVIVVRARRRRTVITLHLETCGKVGCTSPLDGHGWVDSCRLTGLRNAQHHVPPADQELANHCAICRSAPVETYRCVHYLCLLPVLVPLLSKEWQEGKSDSQNNFFSWGPHRTLLREFVSGFTQCPHRASQRIFPCSRRLFGGGRCRQ